MSRKPHEKEHDEHDEKKRKREHKKRARGGKSGEAGGDVYAGAESPTKREGVDKEDGFKRGGHKKPMRKRGGRADGKKSAQRADKRARGGRTGHSPFSSAANVKDRPGADYSGKPSDKSDD